MLSPLKKNKQANNVIGVFDSGLGGLTVLKYLFEELPSYNYIYLGDNARLPYGEKSPEMIYAYTRQAMDFLFRSGCNLVIIACNTATSQALRRLQQEYLPAFYPERRILGVIRPLAENFAAQDWKKIGVIGTKATIDSDAYRTEINKIDQEIRIEQKSTPLLVPLIEEGEADLPETRLIIERYLSPLKEKGVQALILGCTHYPFLHKAIKEIVGPDIAVPLPGEIVAASLKEYLARHPELELCPVSQPKKRYCVTDKRPQFKSLSEGFLGQEIDLECVKISDL